MCVILHGLKKSFLQPELEQAMTRNSDGFSLLDINTKTITRTLDKALLLTAFSAIPDDHYIIFHARIKTQGSATVDNCHGWEKDGVYFFHNGILKDVPSKIDDVTEYKDASDSKIFFELFFMPVFHSQNDTFNSVVNGFVDMVRGVGEYNRMIFVDKAGTIHSYGGFTEDHGIFASNTSYKIPKEINALCCGVHVYTKSDYDDDEYDTGYSYGSGFYGGWKAPSYGYQASEEKKKMISFPDKQPLDLGTVSFPWFTHNTFNTVYSTALKIIRNKKKIDSLISIVRKNNVPASAVIFHEKQSLYGMPEAQLDIIIAKRLVKVFQAMDDLTTIFCKNLESSPYRFLSNQLETSIRVRELDVKSHIIKERKEVYHGANHHVLPAQS